MIDPRPYWYATRSLGLNLNDMLEDGRIVAKNFGHGDVTPFFAGGPASESVVEHAEDRIGQRIPSSLRRFFTECSMTLSVDWSLPHHFADPDERSGLIIDVQAPPEFTIESRNRIDNITRPRPVVSGGRFRIGLVEMVRAYNARAGWVQTYRDVDYGGDDLKAHYNGIADFMEAGFPFATAPNGDWLAIDLRDDCEQLLHVSHEGEEAGIEIAQTFPQFMLHQALLGFVGIDFPEIYRFSGMGDNIPYSESYPLVSYVDFDARKGDNPVWSDWFWGDVARPDIPDDMFEIVTCVGV